LRLIFLVLYFAYLTLRSEHHLGFSIVIGLLMAWLFRNDEREKAAKAMPLPPRRQRSPAH
jgi:hypothetical protein